MKPIRLAAVRDKQYTDKIITEITPDHMTFEDGLSIGLTALAGIQPAVGDTIRLFGRGLGYQVRGMGLVKNGRLAALGRYQTEAEAEAAFVAEQAEATAKKTAAWEADLPKTLDRIAAMPLMFQDRMRRFMKKDGWGPSFGAYELFVCEEAIKILAAATKVAKSEEFIVEFHKAPVETQKLLVGLNYSEHSGNTFDSAVMLARVAVRDPLLVAHTHGALCSLVGCEEYGCYAASPETRAAKKG